ncbi:WHG domain-containing protein [Nocardioides perillae]|uniref:AcrR family transcriptional regulator n=1 Tax=Nocardioides perillae TaxID=1119534 RepID=A0A7Y9UUY5_9ACTN|nr:AcrR family transcriptional regulator [Nocardioides perillae]
MPQAPASTSAPTPAPSAGRTRRERQREATFAEIVTVSRALLADGQELSLRAVASRMGMTAPALYRYVASYQELVDLVAFEVDRAATERLREAAERHPADDPAARLVAAAVAFRRWALAEPREFSLVFANPVADSACVRRELLTAATSGHFMNGLLLDVWQREGFAHPDLADLEPAVAEALRDPLAPVDLDRVPEAARGVLWVFMSAWTQLYGVVTLEVFGHLDPRIIEAGAMFTQFVREWVPRLGLADRRAHYEAVLAAEMAR